jgi:tetratricopeptide (TPR) repeat protein
MLLGKIGDNQFNDQDYRSAAQTYKQYNSRINSVESNIKLARTYRLQDKKGLMQKQYQKVFKKCGPRCKRNPKLRTYGGEALYFLVDSNFKKFMKRKLNNRKLEQSVASMTTQFSQLEQSYTQVVNYQDPKWAVAAMFNIAHIYKKMGSFLSNAKAPKQYNKAQKKEFKKLMREKVNGFKKVSKTFFNSCRKKSIDFNLFSEHALACSDSSGSRSYLVQINDETTPRRVRGFRGRDIHKKLLKKPNNINIMQDLAEIYYNAGDYHMAKAISLKILEKDIRAILGNCYFKLNEHQLAYETLKKVLSSDSSHKDARNGLRRLYKKYNNPKYRGL